jgi:hypothetical protein
MSPTSPVISDAIPRFAAGSSPTTIFLGGAEPDVLGGFSIRPLCLGLRAYSALGLPNPNDAPIAAAAIEPRWNMPSNA